MLKMNAMRNLRQINNTNRLSCKNSQKKKTSGKLAKLIKNLEPNKENKKNAINSQKEVQWSKYNTNQDAESSHSLAGKSPSSVSKLYKKAKSKKSQFAHFNHPMPNKRLNSKKSLPSIPNKTGQSILMTRKTICNTENSEIVERLKCLLNQREKIVNEILYPDQSMYQKYPSKDQFVVRNTVKIPKLKLQNVIQQDEYYPENIIGTGTSDSEFDLSGSLFSPGHEEPQACADEFPLF